MLLNYSIITACVLVIAIGQLLFKTVGTRMGNNGFEYLLTDRQSAFLFLLALAAYGASTFGWVLALRQVPLSTAYLFMSASFVLVPLMSFFVLGEPVSPRIIVGGALIIAGILVAASSMA